MAPPHLGIGAEASIARGLTAIRPTRELVVRHAAKIRRGSALIAEGRSFEEAAEAMEMSSVAAREYLRSALAERGSKTSEARPADRRVEGFGSVRK
jgi:hypothetical protein